MPRMSSLAFFHLVASCSMTVPEAALRYGRSVRTIRRWCEEAPISHRIGGGPHRISVPLADLYALGARRELTAFVNGKAPTEIIMEAFELHGVLDRLVDFHERRLRAEAKRAPPRPLRPLRQA
jgi:hypothetical protein